jgi:cysteine desulfurase
MGKEIYLDNCATTRPYDRVIEYMSLINKENYGNPSSLHTKGVNAWRIIKEARETIAKSVSVLPKDIYFTSGGTESNNLAILGYLKANPRKGNHIITTKIEHPSVLRVFEYLENEGYKVDYINVDKDGIILLDMLEDKISKETALISIMYVNNEVGSIQPIEDIAKIRNTSNKDTVLHIDAVQAYGKMGIDPNRLGVDLMTISSHKIHGPKGVGALYLKKGTKIKPIILGGEQELSLRSGTENVSGIGGFGLASKIIHENIDENLKKVLNVKECFIKLLEEFLGVNEFRILTPKRSTPYIVNVSFKNIKAEVLLHHLSERNIFVSNGAACSSRKNKYSHVLKAMGIRFKEIEGAIRFSFSAENEERDIKKVVEVLKEILPVINIEKYKT